jgi:hypothetical protein
VTTLNRNFHYHERSKNAPINHDSYGLRHEDWNEQLTAEFVVFREWRTTLFNTDRPRRLCQRPTTFDNSINVYENYFGYLIRVHQDNPDALRLATVADPQRVCRFAEWHVKNRTDGQPSRFLERTIGEFCRTARDYLKVPDEQWEEIYRLRQAVVPDTKRDKWKRTVSLATLEEIGLAEQPSLEDLAAAPTRYVKVHLALRAQRSLYIRLLVYRPLRNRNLREMKINDNLYRTDQGWMIEFKGMELKVGRRNGRANLYRLSWPEDLVPELEEFLKVWRPLLPGQARPELFISRMGQPYTVFGLNKEFKKVVFAYTAQAMNLHLVRDVWASEYFASENDITVAAQMLGDTVETVLRHYVEPLRKQNTEVADRFARKAKQANMD